MPDFQILLLVESYSITETEHNELAPPQRVQSLEDQIDSIRQYQINNNIDDNIVFFFTYFNFYLGFFMLTLFFYKVECFQMQLRYTTVGLSGIFFYIERRTLLRVSGLQNHTNMLHVHNKKVALVYLRDFSQQAQPGRWTNCFSTVFIRAYA